MHITLTINLETRQETAEQMRRLAYLFGGPLEQTSTYESSIITRPSQVVQADASVREDPIIFTTPTAEQAESIFEAASIAVQEVATYLATTDAQEPPAKKTRKPRGVQTPLPTTTGEASGPSDLAAALDTALDAMPGMTELTDGDDAQTAVEAPTTLEQEVTAVEDKVAPASMEEGSFDLLADETVVDELVVILDEPVVLPELPSVDDMDLAAAGAEIRRLVIKNTGAWLRDMLNHYKVGRISELSLDQSHDAIRSGRVRAGEVKA